MSDIKQNLRIVARELNSYSKDIFSATPWKRVSSPASDETSGYCVRVCTAEGVHIGRLNREKNIDVYTGAVIEDAVNGEARYRSHLGKYPTEILGRWIYKQLPTQIKQFGIVDEDSGKIILAFDHALCVRLAPGASFGDRDAVQEQFAQKLIAQCNEILEKYRRSHGVAPLSARSADVSRAALSLVLKQ